jgi:uncharacterized membrane protein YraQ (UPF0718 family)
MVLYFCICINTYTTIPKTRAWTATGTYGPPFIFLVIGAVSEYIKGEARIKKIIADSKLYRILGSII